MRTVNSWQHIDDLNDIPEHTHIEVMIQGYGGTLMFCAYRHRKLFFQSSNHRILKDSNYPCKWRPLLDPKHREQYLAMKEMYKKELVELD